MTKPNSTAIVLIVDESGSMSNVTTDTIGGIKTFLDDQKAVPGEATISLVKFNHEPTYLWDFINLQTAPEFTNKEYRPNGNTALLDAIGITIETLGKRLADMSEDERPSSVVVAILTDGEENSSVRFRNAQDTIKSMIKHQTDVYSWKFLFLGANQDAFLSASTLGIDASSTMNFASTSIGTRAAYASVSRTVRRGRTAGGASDSYNFTEQDIQDYNNAIDPANSPTTPIAPVVDPKNP
jgi:hypothetical protein